MKLDIDLKKSALFVIQPYTLQHKKMAALSLTKELKKLRVKMFFWSYIHQVTGDFFNLFPEECRVVELRKERPVKNIGKCLSIDFYSDKYLGQRVRALEKVSNLFSSVETVFIIGGRTEVCIWTLFRDISLQKIPNIIFIEDLLRGKAKSVFSSFPKKSNFVYSSFVFKEKYQTLLKQIESGKLEVEKV